jgi:hypothetical protein
MSARPRLTPLFLFLMAASVALAVPLMLRKQTIINVPEPGTDVALSGLSYKANAFEAKVTSARLELKSDAGADPIVAEWTFLGSNNDGQLHRVEIFVRLQDESGKQIAMYSHKCILNAGARDQACAVEMKIKAADWKATNAVRIVTDWLS